MSRENHRKFNLRESFPYEDLCFNPAHDDFGEVLRNVIAMRDRTIKFLKDNYQRYFAEMEVVDLSFTEEEDLRHDDSRIKTSLEMFYQKAENGKPIDENIWLSNRPAILTSQDYTRCESSATWRRPYHVTVFNKYNVGHEEEGQIEVKSLVFKRKKDLHAVIGGGNENNLLPKRVSLFKNDSAEVPVIPSTVNPATILLMCRPKKITISPILREEDAKTLTNNLGSRFISCTAPARTYMTLVHSLIAESNISTEYAVGGRSRSSTITSNSSESVATHPRRLMSGDTVSDGENSTASESNIPTDKGAKAGSGFIVMARLNTESRGRSRSSTIASISSESAATTTYQGMPMSDETLSDGENSTASESSIPTEKDKKTGLEFISCAPPDRTYIEFIYSLISSRRSRSQTLTSSDSSTPNAAGSISDEAISDGEDSTISDISRESCSNQEGNKHIPHTSEITPKNTFGFLRKIIENCSRSSGTTIDK